MILVEACSEGGDHTEHGKPSQRFARGSLRQHGLNEHDEHARDGKDDLGENAKDLGYRVHRFSSKGGICHRVSAELSRVGEPGDTFIDGAHPVGRGDAHDQHEQAMGTRAHARDANVGATWPMTSVDSGP